MLPTRRPRKPWSQRNPKGAAALRMQIQFGPVVQAAQDSTTHHSAGLLHMLHRNHEANASPISAGLSRSEGLFFTLEAARLSEAVLQQLNLAMPSPAEKVRPPSADDSPQGVVIARATKQFSLPSAGPPRRAGSAAPACQAWPRRAGGRRGRSANRTASPPSAPQGLCRPAAHTPPAEPN
jgi:hypothetical protein